MNVYRSIATTSSTSTRCLAKTFNGSKSSAVRLLSTTPSTLSSRSDSPFDRPGPPPLPKEEQAEWNRLVKEKGNQLQFQSAQQTQGQSQGQKDEMHPDARRKPQPDFEGETNPRTGEIGGPKKDPLQWEREWTYGGRATDF
ncbi:unnamed protein product [Sympodiomycopsis kandeliae]